MRVPYSYRFRILDDQLGLHTLAGPTFLKIIIFLLQNAGFLQPTHQLKQVFHTKAIKIVLYGQYCIPILIFFIYLAEREVWCQWKVIQ